MRVFVTSMLIGLVVFRMAGYIALSLVQIGAQHTAVLRSRTQQTGHVVFRFATRDFFRKTHGGAQHEFWHDGRLYDVKHIVSQGDSLRVAAVADDFESHLLAGLDAFFHSARRHSDAGAPGHWLAKILAQPYLPAAASGLFCRVTDCYQQGIFPLLFMPPSADHEVISPPPEARCCG